MRQGWKNTFGAWRPLRLNNTCGSSRTMWNRTTGYTTSINLIRYVRGLFCARPVGPVGPPRSRWSGGVFGDGPLVVARATVERPHHDTRLDDGFEADESDLSAPRTKGLIWHGTALL